MTKKIKLFTGSLIILTLLTIAGCNTVAGFGEDVQAGGQALTSEADKHK